MTPAKLKLPATTQAPQNQTGRMTMTSRSAGVAVTVTRANPLHPHDAALIRAELGETNPITEAIAHHLGETGSVYLELPDGRLTVVLDLEGAKWIPRARDEGFRG
jgi:hypothetical protein